ncbi:MAG: methionyl-tRNA formyltransferase [Coriobacteriales bacterium]|nr:methionyl-tRNA formyltransferase [Coriobacteriales bacterium]
MRVVFMGTPEFAVPSLRALAGRHDVTCVVTRPDAVRGRGRKLVPSPVKAVALELGLPVLETVRVDDEVVARVAHERPDVVCVAAYGALLPDDLLSVAPMGCVNVHASLLPHGRGAAPIQRAVLEGDEVAGVSIMRIVHDLDAGPYCRQASVAIGEQPCVQLMGALAELGAEELCLALDAMTSGEATWTDQDESQVTYAAKVQKTEMRLDPADSALANRRRVQASLDAAPARLSVGGRGVRALDARLSDVAAEPAQVIVHKGRVHLGCADGALELLRVKPDGKREMDAAAWAAGIRGDGIAWGRA